VKLKVLFIANFLGIAIILFTNTTWAQIAPDTLVNQTNPNATLNKTSGNDTINEYVDEIIKFSKKFLGTPYQYAGSTPSGFDCSGFINFVMGNFGFQLSRSSPGIAEFGKTVKLSELQPGDLMFFKGRSVNSTSVGHVAMVIEVNNGVIKFIHSSTSRGVVIDTFNGSQYYVPRYLKAKRLDYGVVDASNFR
jgi:cell wall-associated NlpC family hydrolase